MGEPKSRWAAIKERRESQLVQVEIKKAEGLRRRSPGGPIRVLHATVYGTTPREAEPLITEPGGCVFGRLVTPVDEILKRAGLEPQPAKPVYYSQTRGNNTRTETLIQTEYHDQAGKLAALVTTVVIPKRCVSHRRPLSPRQEITVKLPESVASKLVEPQIVLRKPPERMTMESGGWFRI